MNDFPQEKYKKYLGFICVIRKIKLDGKRLFFFLQVVLDLYNNPVNAQDVNTHIAKMNHGQLAGYEGRDRCCIVLQSEYVTKVHGAIVDVAINAAAVAWKDSIGAPAIGSNKCTRFDSGTAHVKEFVDHLSYNYAHYDYYVGQEVFIESSLTYNKKYKKYEKFVDWRGVIMRIISRDSKDFTLFVKPMYDQDNKPVYDQDNKPTFDIDFQIRQLNGESFRFLNGPDRDILNCLPCKAAHLCVYNAYSFKRAEHKRAQRAVLAMLSDAAEQSGSKKARI